MEILQKRKLSMFRRVSTLLDDERDNSRIARPLAMLRDIIEQVNETAVLQQSLDHRKRSLTLQIADRADFIRRHLMGPIRIVAKKAIPVLDSDGNRLKSALVLPKWRDDYEGHVRSALVFADAVEEFAESFAKRWLPAGYPEELRESSEALRTAIDARARVEQRRMGCTRELIVLMRDGVEFVRILDGILQRRKWEDSAWAAKWRAAVRIPDRRGRPRRDAENGAGEGREDADPLSSQMPLEDAA